MAYNELYFVTRKCEPQQVHVEHRLQWLLLAGLNLLLDVDQDDVLDVNHEFDVGRLDIGYHLEGRFFLFVSFSLKM